MRFALIVLFCALALQAPAAVAGQDSQAEGPSGLPLPRFASLRANDVNMRTGPGTRHPIDWVYRHQGLPIEITAEYDVWRRVKDWEGSEGWVHKSVLTGKRTAIITGDMRDMRESESLTSPVVAHLEPGVTGQLLSCNRAWCHLKIDKIKGYLPKDDFWGAFPDEVF